MRIVRKSKLLLVLPWFAVAGVLGLLVILMAHNNTRVANADDCSVVMNPLSSFITDSVNANRPFYDRVSDATGVPWEMLAAIHYRETSFSHTNPGNGYGIFQFTPVPPGKSYPPGPVSDAEFESQLLYMAQRIQSDYVNRGSLNYPRRPLVKNEPDIYRVKDTLFSYNGRSSQYAQQAAQYGFNPTSEPYEGSPYVMNRFDCKRKGMGLITKDYGPIDGVDTRLGAFTLYARLKGDSYWLGLVSNTLPRCDEATNTALDCIWLMQNTSTGVTKITNSDMERASLVNGGFQVGTKAFYGIVSRAPRPNNVPVYRLTKPGGDTFLTASSAERNTLISTQGFTDNGIFFYADIPWSNSGYPVYRLFSPSINKHRWTSSFEERNQLLSAGYNDEGVAFTSMSPVYQEIAAPSGRTLVYRFYIPQKTSHFWTQNLTERDDLIRAGYRYEGVGGYGSSNLGDLPVYRLYSLIVGKHLYTTNTAERDNLISTGTWRNEGVSHYVSRTVTSKPVYRLFTPIATSHLLTTNAAERDELVRIGTFRYEGVAWYQPE